MIDRYYYSALPEREQKIYRELYNGVLRQETDIPLSCTAQEASRNDSLIRRIYGALLLDHPQLYYLRDNGYRLQLRGSSCHFMMEYTISMEDVRLYNQRMDSLIRRLFEQLSLKSLSHRDALRRIHDYIALNMTYDHEALEESSGRGRQISAHSIIGLFSRQCAVCDGISEFLKLILNLLDIPCIVVEGTGTDGAGESGGHAWNIVKINGCAAHLDMTWDMNRTAEGTICYDYYCVPETAIRRDHSDFSGIPACTSWAENDHFRRNMLFDTRQELFSRAARCLQRGQTSLDFRMKIDPGDMEQMTLQLRREMMDRWMQMHHTSVRGSCSCNAQALTGRVSVEGSVH